jgi:hypothetical protein
MHSLLLIEEYGITWQNGAVLIFGTLPFIVIVTILIRSYSYIFIRPANSKELFNLRHASARNIIERMFGILKNRFEILQHNPHLTPKVQAHLPAALAAIHNVIRKYDPGEIEDRKKELDVEEFDIDELDPDTEGELAKGPPRPAEKKDVERRRDEMAECMWIQYQQVLQDRGE